MSFIKFSSIENTYRQKFIDKFGDLSNKKFIAREKLDGANIQLLITPTSKMQVGKRTSFLEETDSFFDIWNTLDRYKNQIDTLKDLSHRDNLTIRVYGEIYGPGINKRVDYGEEKQIAIFDIWINDKQLTQQELIYFCFDNKLLKLLPVMYLIGSLDECLAFDVENLKNRPGGEGIVIQPLEENIYTRGGERLILKKKANAFEDTRQEAIDKGAGRAEAKEHDIIYLENKKFKNYITENRVVDIFAKYGSIKEPKQISEYIKYVLDDAKADYLKDNDIKTIIPDLDTKKEKDIFNVGSLIVQILKTHL